MATHTEKELAHTERNHDIGDTFRALLIWDVAKTFKRPTTWLIVRGRTTYASQSKLSRMCSTARLSPFVREYRQLLALQSLLPIRERIIMEGNVI